MNDQQVGRRKRSKVVGIVRHWSQRPRIDDCLDLGAEGEKAFIGEGLFLENKANNKLGLLQTRIIDSKTPPICDALGGLKWKSIPICQNFDPISEIFHSRIA